MTFYSAGDVRAIQGYIFGSPRLLEMRGASSLLGLFDHQAVPALIAEFEGDKGFSGGGNFLARFPGEGAARGFQAAVANAFLDLTGSEGLTTVVVQGSGEFREDQRRLARELRWTKRHPQGAAALESMPFLKRCESCGREAAERLSRMGAAPGAAGQWIGPMCQRKRAMHAATQSASHQGDYVPRIPVFGLAEPVDTGPLHDELTGFELPKDFQELVQNDDLAVIVADGNGLGDWFQDLDWEPYKELSRSVDEALRHSLGQAIHRVKGSGSGTTLPVQPLIAGGDDLVAALPARLAVQFARTLLEEFEVPHPVTKDQPEKRLSAGVLLAKASFPFQQAHRLAEELLRRAKNRSRGADGTPTLDLLRVKGSHVQSLAAETQAVERGSPTGDRWSYGAAGPYTLDELDDLLALRAVLREVTPSQRGRLREILSPRGDGEHTPLDERWGVPRRVLAELEHWLERQDDSVRKRLPALDDAGRERALRDERLADGRRVRRLKLADALMLSDLGGD